MPMYRKLIAAVLLMTCTLGFPMILVMVQSLLGGTDSHGLARARALDRVALDRVALDRVDGTRFSTREVVGHPTYVFFGFTHCHDVCPRALGTLSALAGTAPEEVRILFVTVDPERDDPQRLHALEQGYDGRMIALRGTREEIATFAAAFRARVAVPATSRGEDYQVVHSGNIYLLDRSGMLRLVYPETQRDVRHMLRDLEKIMEEPHG